MHGEVLAITALILMQRRGEILGTLSFELRHTVHRVGVLVSLDTMATEAGVGDRFAVFGIALQRLILGRHRRTRE